MYTIELSCAEDHYETIVGFRKEICRNIGLDENGISVSPLKQAVYIFGYIRGEQEPIGMIEIFMYDQIFESYSDSVYSHATDLGKIAPIDKLGHVRSVILLPKYQRTRLFLLLVAGLVLVASSMGALYLTAGTGLHNLNILALHQRAGMKPLGFYIVDNSPQQLSLLDLDPLLVRARKIYLVHSLDIDTELINKIRNRKR